MAKKKKKNQRIADCAYCENYMPVCDGYVQCEEDPTMTVFEDYNIPSDDYMWCRGKYFRDSGRRGD